MIFGKHINRYYLKYFPQLLLGMLTVIFIDYMQLLIPNLYQMVVNGMNQGFVLQDGVQTAFNMDFLLDHIWGYEYIGDTRTVDVHIKRLREKIKDNDHWSLATVWGIGYKFEVKR